MHAAQASWEAGLRCFGVLMAPRRRKPAAPTSQALLQQAWQIADDGDVWFVSVAQGLSQIGTWARHEADAAVGSLATGLTVTLDATKKLTGRAFQLTATCPQQGGSATSASGAGQARHRPGAGRALCLVSATLEGSAELASGAPAGLESCNQGEWKGDGPGVLPLVQAMGQVVADHADAGYTTLADDERMWTLLGLLQELSRPPEASSPLPHAPRQPDAHSTVEHSGRRAGAGETLESNPRAGHWCCWRPGPNAVSLAQCTRPRGGKG
jgi:hypothetical protein